MSARDEESYAHWSRLHDDLDPRGSAWVRGWVRLAHAVARPLARRGVRADAVTATAVLLTATVPPLAAAGAAWPLLGAAVLVAAAVLDGVDGALAARTGTASPWGRVLDPAADRVCDTLLVLALVLLGAPGWWGAVLVVLTLLLESVRATAQAAGMRGPGTVSVWERPSRVIVAAFGLGLAGLDVLPGLDAATLAGAAVGVGLVLAVVGLTQMVRAVRRALTT